MNRRWRCDECGHIATIAEMLTAPNPFADCAEIRGCPKCKAVESFSHDLCDEPGCNADACCGWPSEAGYRRTCAKHWSDGRRKK